MSAADEILDVVDEDDNVVGRAPRGEVYARGLRHRAVFV
ncbi:NUDIX hydrolase, partial [Streptomyces sp. NPDC059873]